MRTLIIFIFFIFLISNFVSASVKYDNPNIPALRPPVTSIETGGNYTINVNNSQYLQGYTPTTLKDWMQGLFDDIYCKLTGCTMVGNIDMDGNAIIDADLSASSDERWNDTSDTYTATLTVCANNSLRRNSCDYQCDGVGDQIEINSAIRNLSSIGGEVRLLDGNYSIYGYIDLENNVKLSGVGYGTVIKGGNEYDAPVYISGKEFVEVSNIQFVGQRSGGFHGGYGGLHISNSSNIRILNNKFTLCDNQAIYFTGFVNNIILQGNDFIENQRGFDFVGATGSNYLITGNSFIDDEEGPQLAGVDDLIFSGNLLSYKALATGGNSAGLTLVATENVMIFNNKISNANNTLLPIVNQTGINIGCGGATKPIGTMIMNNNLNGNQDTTIQNCGINTTIVGNYPGGASMEIQTAEGQEIKMIPEGTHTATYFAENTTFLTNIFNRNVTIDNSIKDANSDSYCFWRGGNWGCL